MTNSAPGTLATPKRILVVDDDPEIQQLVRLLLSRLGVELVIVGSAAAAAEALKTPPLPNLIVLDLMMPEVSGLDFLKQMRARPAFDHIPVLVLSALIESSNIREALNSGADRYLTKPYIANNLVTIVQEILRTGRRREASS